jgi:hypothetical protein
VSWSSKRQPVISRSSAEAEYRDVANGVAEAAWLRQLLAELHSPLSRSTLVYCDNISAVYLSTNPVQHQSLITKVLWSVFLLLRLIIPCFVFLVVHAGHTFVHIIKINFLSAPSNVYLSGIAPSIKVTSVLILISVVYTFPVMSYLMSVCFLFSKTNHSLSNPPTTTFPIPDTCTLQLGSSSTYLNCDHMHVPVLVDSVIAENLAVTQTTGI